MRFVLPLVSPLVLIGLMGSTVLAQPEHPAKAELLADVASVKPGEPFTVGIRMTMRQHWHVYWINPGDSGQPPHAKWTLPDGFTVSELQFPVPKKFQQAGDLVGYGYEGEVLLTATVTPRTNLKVGDKLSIAADVSWLVCDPSVCIPGDAKLSMNLPVAESVVPANHELFKTWLERMPVPPDRIESSVTFSKNYEKRELQIAIAWKNQVPKHVEWFPPPTPDVEFGEIKTTTARGATVVVCKFTVLAKKPLPEETLRSVLAYDGEDGTRRGVVVPFDLKPARTDILLPTD